MKPDISFVVATLNEEQFLTATLESLAQQELHGHSAEVLVVDGGSSDGSVEIAERFAAEAKYPVRFRLIRNPRRRTPAAFNIGIREAAGAIIGFGGAHTIYPRHYFLTAIELLRSGIAEVVGGGHNSHVPSVDSTAAHAMACLYVSPMGSGVAAYHRRRQPGFVDTVYGGLYHREVLDLVGGFNETLTRNQDNELNARVLGAGMRIYFHPALSTQYVLKADLKTFLKRGYLFGRYHPETWLQTPEAFRLRHAIPGLFALYILAVVVLNASHFRWWLQAPLLLYVVLLVVAALQVARTRPLRVSLLSIPLFVAYHLSYGVGTLVGVVRGAAGLGRSRARPFASPIRGDPEK